MFSWVACGPSCGYQCKNDDFSLKKQKNPKNGFSFAISLFSGGFLRLRAL